MKVRIFNDGQPAYMTTVTDVETKEELCNVTDVDLHISVKDPWPYALITLAMPVVDVILDAEIRRVCPCCGRDWQPAQREEALRHIREGETEPGGFDNEKE